jgi:serine phosphatase RsbU (regulator of sigma subunit)
MQLNNNHRESLLNELQKAKEEIELARFVQNSSDKEQFTEHFKDWQDIKMFLLQERVKLIEKSLIENEVDF